MIFLIILPMIFYECFSKVLAYIIIQGSLKILDEQAKKYDFIFGKEKVGQ